MPRTKREGKSTKTVTVGGIAGDHLKSYIERIERLTEEKASLGSDITEVFAEAKDKGFSPKIMRQVIRIRAMDEEDRTEEEALRDLYMQALGELPLFERAKAEEGAETDNMRPIGEVAAKVVETVAAGRRPTDSQQPDSQQPDSDASTAQNPQNTAAAPADSQQSDSGKDIVVAARALDVVGIGPDKQEAAKLAGEEAGSKGEPKTANPYPGAHPLHGWWSKGHMIGLEDHRALGNGNGQAEPEAKSGPTPRSGRPGFKDKTARMGAASAAKMLGGGAPN